jgi:hypothetical protein
MASATVSGGAPARDRYACRITSSAVRRSCSYGPDASYGASPWPPLEVHVDAVVRPYL